MKKDKMDFQMAYELYDLLNNENLQILIKILDKDCPREHGLKDYCLSSYDNGCVNCWKKSLEERLSKGSEIDETKI